MTTARAKRPDGTRAPAPPLTAGQQGLVESCAALPGHLFARLRGRGRLSAYDQDRLRGMAVDSLVRAARYYDPSRGVPFSAFAARVIRGAIGWEAARMHRRPRAARLPAEDYEPRPWRQRRADTRADGALELPCEHEDAVDDAEFLLTLPGLAREAGCTGEERRALRPRGGPPRPGEAALRAGAVEKVRALLYERGEL